MKHAMDETKARPQWREWRCFHRLVRWFRHAFGQHNRYCKAAGSWDIDTGKQVRGHHCTVTKWETKEEDHFSSSNDELNRRAQNKKEES